MNFPRYFEDWVETKLFPTNDPWFLALPPNSAVHQFSLMGERTPEDLFKDVATFVDVTKKNLVIVKPVEEETSLEKSNRFMWNTW